MTDWTAFAERCLAAPRDDDPDGPVNEVLRSLAREISHELMPRDDIDYPSVGTRMSEAVTLGDAGAALALIEELFPGWGYQVGRPLTVRSSCGWYASVFRERRSAELRGPLAGMFTQDGRKDTEQARYANSPSMALMAALCRVLAAEQPGASAIAA
jgi:hypothetical protein